MTCRRTDRFKRRRKSDATAVFSISTTAEQENKKGHEMERVEAGRRDQKEFDIWQCVRVNGTFSSLQKSSKSGTLKVIFLAKADFPRLSVTFFCKGEKVQLCQMSRLSKVFQSCPRQFLIPPAAVGWPLERTRPKGSLESRDRGKKSRPYF